jgi:hypothetical protein
MDGARLVVRKECETVAECFTNGEEHTFTDEEKQVVARVKFVKETHTSYLKVSSPVFANKNKQITLARMNTLTWDGIVKIPDRLVVTEKFGETVRLILEILLEVLRIIYPNECKLVPHVQKQNPQQQQQQRHQEHNDKKIVLFSVKLQTSTDLTLYLNAGIFFVDPKLCQTDHYSIENLRGFPCEKPISQTTDSTAKKMKLHEITVPHYLKDSPISLTKKIPTLSIRNWMKDILRSSKSPSAKENRFAFFVRKDKKTNPIIVFDRGIKTMKNFVPIIANGGVRVNLSGGDVDGQSNFSGCDINLSLETGNVTISVGCISEKYIQIDIPRYLFVSDSGNILWTENSQNLSGVEQGEEESCNAEEFIRCVKKFYRVVFPRFSVLFGDQLSLQNNVYAIPIRWTFDEDTGVFNNGCKYIYLDEHRSPLLQLCVNQERKLPNFGFSEFNRFIVSAITNVCMCYPRKFTDTLNGIIGIELYGESVVAVDKQVKGVLKFNNNDNNTNNPQMIISKGDNEQNIAQQMATTFIEFTFEFTENNTLSRYQTHPNFIIRNLVFKLVDFDVNYNYSPVLILESIEYFLRFIYGGVEMNYLLLDPSFVKESIASRIMICKSLSKHCTFVSLDGYSNSHPVECLVVSTANIIENLLHGNNKMIAFSTRSSFLSAFTESSSALSLKPERNQSVDINSQLGKRQSNNDIIKNDCPPKKLCV